MTELSTGIGLAVTIRPDLDPGQREQMCRLAARLGYESVWLPAVDLPRERNLQALITAAAPARVGVVLDDAGPHLEWLASTRGIPGMGELLVDVAPGASREGLLAALGGPEEFGRRVFSRQLDPGAAGYTVHAERRDDTLAVVEAAAADAAGPRISVDLPVVFGRTMGEAEARLIRDPWLSYERDPRIAGIFGTFADAQSQVLALGLAGAHTIRATLANEADFADLLAQLRAVVVGPVAARLSLARPDSRESLV